MASLTRSKSQSTKPALTSDTKNFFVHSSLGLKPTISYLSSNELELVHNALKELDWESIAAGLLHDTVEVKFKPQHCTS